MQLNENSHVVSCVDILGYKEVLHRNDQEELDNIKANFLYFIELNSQRESGFPGFEYVTYTDNFLFYYKLDYNSNKRKRHDFVRESFGENVKNVKTRVERVLYLHIFSLALSQFDLAANNIFIRGGLTIGGFNADGKIISGSGLIDAHDLEEKAVYPRIILNQSVVKEFITSSKPIPLLYDKTDDIIFIDFLSAKMREDLHLEYEKIISNGEADNKRLDLFKSELSDVKDNIINAIQVNTEDKVIKKYKWLADYFNYFCYSHEKLGLNELVIDTHKDANESLNNFRPVHYMT